MRRAFTLIELLVVIAIIAILCGLMPGDAAMDMIFRLLCGWAIYPFRLASDRSVDWPAVGLCLGCLAGLTVGVHCFGQWFAAHRSEEAVWPWPRTFKLVGLLMLMFLAGIAAIGVTHQIVWMATTKDRMVDGSRFRQAAAHVQSTNNLKQIALAAHHYHDKEKILPAGAMFDKQGRALHGWQTSLLPYLDQDALYQKIDLTVPWNDPKNAVAMKEQVRVFLHSAADAMTDKPHAVSHYAGNIHVLGATPMKLGDITDGPANTILFGEVAHNFKPWGMPMNCRDPAVGFGGPHGFANPMGRSVVFAMADGSVRVIRLDVDPKVLKALSTPRGGEPNFPID